MDSENVKKIVNQLKAKNPYGEDVTLVAAIKYVDADTVNESEKLGIKHVAENKVQEFLEKSPLLSETLDSQFIGHLQTNKVKYICGKVSLIQSVDSLHLAEEISKFAVKKGITQDILLEINIGGELSKSGFTPDTAIENAKAVAELNGVKIKGLMAMLPHSDDKELLKSLCKKMRAIYDELKNGGFDFNYLSIGMSEDYELAISCGSNMVRLGSILYGKRNYEVK